MSALSYILTVFVRIPLPNGGYMHLGNAVIVAAACIFGPLFGAAVGVIGSALADLTVAPIWIPYTVVIKFIVGVSVGFARKKPPIIAAMCYFISIIAVAGGYYAAEAIIYGNWLAPVHSTIPLITEQAASLLIGIFAAKKIIILIR